MKKANGSNSSSHSRRTTLRRKKLNDRRAAELPSYIYGPYEQPGTREKREGAGWLGGLITYVEYDKDFRLVRHEPKPPPAKPARAPKRKNRASKRRTRAARRSKVVA